MICQRCAIANPIVESSSVAQGGALNLAGQQLQTSLSPWPFVEDGAQSLAIEPQTESVFLRKLGVLCLAIFVVNRPEAFQFVLVNSAVSQLANLAFQFAFRLIRLARIFMPPR